MRAEAVRELDFGFEAMKQLVLRHAPQGEAQAIIQKLDGLAEETQAAAIRKVLRSETGWS